MHYVSNNIFIPSASRRNDPFIHLNETTALTGVLIQWVLAKKQTVGLTSKNTKR